MEVHLELMASIKEMSELDRPREKAIHYGVETLSDAELIASLIGSGYHGISSLDIANELLSKYNGLTNLSKVGFAEIKNNKGIKEARALNLQIVFELHNRLISKSTSISNVPVSNELLFKRYKDYLARQNQEILILIILDSRKRIIRERVLYRGNETNITYSFKDIYREILNYNGKSFYLIHNHPGGDSSPSQKDILVTNEIYLESKRNGVPLVDHLIFGHENYYSFKEMKKTTISC